MYKISVTQVLLRLQKESRTFIEILGISLAEYEKFLYKFCSRYNQRRRDTRNHNVDTWNPEYGFKLLMSKRQMPLLS